MKTDMIPTTFKAIKSLVLWALFALPALLTAQNVTWVGGGGATTVDRGDVVTYSVNLNGTSLSQWSWSNYTNKGQVVGTPTSTSITIQWNDAGSSAVWYIYEPTTAGGQEFELRRSVTINEIVVPAPTLSTVTHPICPEVNGTFTITNYDNQYTYTAVPSTGVVISGNTVTAPAGSYVIRASLGSSVSDNSVNRSVNAPTTSAVPVLQLVSEPTCSDESQGTFKIVNYDANVTYSFDNAIVQQVADLVTVLPGTYRAASLPTGAPQAQCLSDWSNSIAIGNPPAALSAGTIDTTTQEICYNSDAGLISGTAATGEDGNYTYTWMYASSQNGDYTAISNTNSESYDPFADLLGDRWYKRRVEACGQIAFTQPVLIDVSPSLSDGGTINAPAGVCEGGNPATITSNSGATGGGDDLSYEWSWSLNQNGTYTEISNSNSETYNPPVLSTSRWYQRTATSCGQTVSSNKVLVEVVPTLSAPTGTDSYSVCGSASTILSLTADPNADVVRWYDSPTGGSVIGEGDITRGPGVYYATSYHNNGCESPRISVSVNSTSVLQWYPDADNDGYRDPGSTFVNDCSDRGDFWTQDPEEDLCPNVFSTDNAPPSVWYVDEDNDGLRDSDTDTGESDCNARGNGWTTETTLDNCPGLSDPTNPQPQVWYADLENGGQGDGLGDPNMPSEPLCVAPAGYVANSNDQCPDFLSPTNDCAQVNVNCSSAGNTPVAINFTGDNYSYTRTYQEEKDGIPTTRFDSDDAYIQQITYFDGLGRPMQQNAVRQSPSQKDIITHMEYDAYGRMVKEWLPFQDDSNHPIGTFRSGNMAQETKDYYGIHYVTDFNAEINPFAEKQFEGSPLNRIEKQAAPGGDWAMGSGHEIEFAYGTNSAADAVRRFDVLLDPLTDEPSLVQRPDYAPGDLYRNITRDENHDGSGNDHTITEFTDKQGRVVLKRTYNNEEAHDTYYVYDDFGNLTYVLPPKMNGNTAHMNELGYQYVYDYRNRLVEKRIPGKGKEVIVYNTLDQPIMTQDANQRLNNEWLFTKYDAFGRVAYTGKAVDSRNRTALQSEADAVTQPWVDQTAANQQGSFTGISDAIYYDNGAYPSGTMTELLTINYYDTYVGQGATVPTTITPLGESLAIDATANNVNGLATVSRVKVLDQTPAQWITTVTYYDDKARPIYVHSTNDFLETVDIVETELDFVGKPLKTRTTHSRTINTTTTTIVTIDNFTYDHSGRLLAQTQCIGDGSLGTSCPAGTITDTSTELVLDGTTVTDTRVHHQRIVVTNSILDEGAELYIDPTSNGSGSQELIVYNTYDNLGLLESKKVGGAASVTNGTVGANGLQTVAYEYNVRGWLTAINDVNSTNTLFNFKIGYNEGANPLYNGNISSTQWRTANTDNALKSYTYGYDALNRITGASGAGTMSKYDLSGITYDKNGNLLSLTRMGPKSATPVLNDSDDSDYGMMDVLDYAYHESEMSNRLYKVRDDGEDAFGFKDSATDVQDYWYDDNGNLTQDLNKGITSVEYNHLNMPTEIKFNNSETQKINYSYTSSGVKVRKTVNDNGNITTTDYAGAYQYVNNNLEFINNIEDGYVYPKSGGGFGYTYYYTDQLDNIRLSYTDVDGNGSIDPSTEIIKEANFYPFGLVHKGYNTTVNPIGSSFHKYDYQNQERQDELGLNWLQFKYRMHDPAIGRFVSIDPLADSYVHNSTYAFAENKVIKFNELEGLEITLNKFDKLNSEGAQGFHLTAINAANAGISLINGGIDTFNYAGTLTDPDAPLTGLSFGANKLGNDISKAAGAVKNYLDTKNIFDLGNDVKAMVQNPDFADDVAGGFLGGALTKSLGTLGTISKASNPVPNRLARVRSAEFSDSPTLGAPNASDAFVTAASDLKGISTAEGLAKRLTLLDSNGNLQKGPFQVIEFDTPSTGLSSPVFRDNPGFIGGGKTIGGAREFTLPNLKIPELKGVTLDTKF